MKTIQIQEVVVPEERQRRDFDKKTLKELQDSIAGEVGLLQPIILRNDSVTLVAGERRLRAVADIYEAKGKFRHDNELVPDQSIPFVTVDELSVEQLHEAELAENAIRVNLSWQERARAIAELHHFRVGQRGLYDRSSGEGQSIKATASEVLGHEALGSQAQEVADAILLTEFLDDPLVAAAPDIKTAKKAIREDLANRERLARAKVFDSAGTKHTLILGSAFDVEYEAGKYHTILTDPPYGIDAHKTDTFDADSHEYDDSIENFRTIVGWLPRTSFTLAAEQAHLYCFCDIRRFTELFVEFELSGWDVWPRPIIWDKGNTGSYGDIEHGPRSCYEAILFANKGRRRVTAGYRDVINITQKTNSKHPAGKPVELYTELLKRSALPGDHVIDFFAGSGPIFPAAEEQKVFATGIELNEKYHAMCVERLEELK
ncbi:MAG: DNA modification methylase [Ignavibacteria bacterium]|nr:DNA modification methylase [Ignavibacteria bacterium]